MLSKTALRKSLEMTRKWFRESGVMIPENGMWGVAERVLLTRNNKTARKTLDAFPAWTPHEKEGYCIIEQRRADCCMQTAFLCLRLHEIFGIQHIHSVARNLLSFLFHRSGLLQRTGGEHIEGAWNWSHIRSDLSIWFDDNAWMAVLMLKMSAHYPELNREFGLKEWGLKLADLLAQAFPRYFADEKASDGTFSWHGNLRLPHWGSLVCQALAEAMKFHPKKEYRAVIDEYHRYLLDHIDAFTPSEYGYALLGATAAYAVMKDNLSLKTARAFADRIAAVMDPATGNLPSRHYEAPNGDHLADTIYTLNWAALAMQNMAQFDDKYTAAGEKILELLLRIQDTSDEPWLYGCWRGMYDLKSDAWGGGDSYEGGASSIYTGWTNAPIAWTMAFAMQHKCFAVH
ncbi:MAG: hypothetical protein J5806_03570 [Lentisphaeria bacterium]|nr:hypothetical protein [Lentisphaeria bacterium]